MDADLQQYLPVLIVIGGVIAAGLFVKKTGWFGIVLIGLMAAIWIFKTNPQWFDKLDGIMGRIVEVDRK
ncbi:hypothetical protein [Cerasicoccus fimbriatus]|uniref:hypothetical protein n=1 Tax=Cerasicoccus fimbriatus TaxID=3014554 RepID=UPI0022B5E026|nr:hypothetical protein [Cerasicoccus sp. TK19100]